MTKKQLLSIAETFEIIAQDMRLGLWNREEGEDNLCGEIAHISSFLDAAMEVAVVDALAPEAGPTSGALAIVRERCRQITEEGFTAEHDDQWRNYELLRAAVFYAAPPGYEREPWPWDEKWNKTSTHGERRQLEIAGALIAAEIDRIDEQHVKKEVSHANAE